MKKRLVLFTSILLVLAMIITGCFSPTVKAGDENAGSTKNKILRANNGSEPGSLDPALAQGTHESWILENVFEGLMTFDENGKLVEGMTESYEVSEDGTTYTFILRDGITWTNGDPITAEDFEYSWKRALAPETAGNHASILYYIKGAEAYNAGEGSVDDVLITALNEKALEVTLETPIAYFLELTAFHTYFPISKNVAEKNPDWAKSPATYVSNGPFKLVEWKHNDKIILEKNKDYYNAKKIKLDGIDLDILEDQNTAWQKYQGGEYDILVDVPASVINQLKQEGNPELKIGLQIGTYYYNINPNIKPFNNPKVRKGLSMAINREAIVEQVTQGGQLPAVGIIPPGMKDENDDDFRNSVGDLIKYDTEEAKILFDKGLSEEGMTVEKFNNSNFVILYNTAESQKKIAEAIQEMWRELFGIKIGLENVDFQTKLEREQSGDYQVSRSGWMVDFMDPVAFLDLWCSDSAFNDAKYSNPKYDELIKEAKSTNDQNVRMGAMKEAETILMEDMPVIPIYFYTQPYTVKSNVTGIFKVPVRCPIIAYADLTE
ncbi:MAG TPA: peptide ABC transporter substrate-binding protein [Clostridia bacterium]|nr:peptide ABC transporter substrate-binding protein [Clostridia bacterium]